MAQMPSREWLRRFAEAAEAYRKAFREVQKQLRDTDMGRIPAWCFAVDRMELAELERLAPALATAERERRQWRVALHALSEYIALHGDADPALPSIDGGNEEELIESLRGDGDAELDRFITVINYARSGGVIYVNGTFEPVKGGPHSQPPPQTGDASSDS